MTAAFVAGATGFVGREVVRALRAREVRVVAHVRPESRKLDRFREQFAAEGIEVDTTPWQPAAMTEALIRSGASHVFGLLGTTRSQARAEGLEGDIYERVDYGLTRLLCEAAVAAGTRARFVLLSSVGVGPRAPSPYLRAHHKAEVVVRESGLPWLIVRPSFIVPMRGGAGRDDPRRGEKLAAVVADGALAAIGLFAPRIRGRYRSIGPRGLATAITRLALDGEPDRVVDGAELQALIP
jgi:uncharacterized protein YbjT (DUF2867 family)